MSNPPRIETVPFLSAGDLAVGDVVEFAANYAPKFKGQVFRVTKTLQKNVMLEDENGGTLRTDPFMLLRSDKPFTPNEGPALVLGSLVRLKPRNAGRWGDTLFSVVDNPKGGKVRLAKVGGDKGRWLPGVPVTALDVIDPADVLR
jgi:hypothetical protein